MNKKNISNLLIPAGVTKRLYEIVQILKPLQKYNVPYINFSLDPKLTDYSQVRAKIINRFNDFKPYLEAMFDMAKENLGNVRLLEKLSLRTYENLFDHISFSKDYVYSNARTVINTELFKNRNRYLGVEQDTEFSDWLELFIEDTTFEVLEIYEAIIESTGR